MSSHKQIRPYASSEVLLLEALQVAKRRRWHAYAIRLVLSRANLHVATLEQWARSPVLLQAATADRAAASEQPDNVAGDGRALSERLHDCIQAASRHRDEIRERQSALSLDGALDAAIALLDAYDEQSRRLPDSLREAIDRDLADAHRRFVLTGKDPHAGQRSDPPSADDLLATDDEKIHAYAFSGLALSGGGVRSATFALGAIQAMSRFELLRVFDYVSAVSGGGWAAGWLAAWSHRHKAGIQGVEDEIFKSRPGDSAPLRWVRRHIAYLAPRPGLTSGDTWALFVAYVSNWLPIITLAALALLALLILPHALSSTAKALSEGSTPLWRIIEVSVTGSVLISFMVLLRRLTLYYREPGPRVRRSPAIFFLVFGGTLVSTVSLAMSMPVVAQMATDDRVAGALPPWTSNRAVLVGAAWFSVTLIAATGAWALSTAYGQRVVDRIRWALRQPMTPSGTLMRHQVPMSLEVLAQITSALVVTALVTMLLPLATTALKTSGYRIALGPIILVAIFGVAELFGLMITRRRDVDRAWISRIGGWMLAALSGWTILCLFALGSTSLWRDPLLRDLATVVALVLTGLVLLCSWLIARASRERKSFIGFIAGMLLLAPLLPLAAGYLTRNERGELLECVKVWSNLAWVMLPFAFLLWVCNVNRYSLHAIYRQGLVRTFLGASRLALRNNLGLGDEAEDSASQKAVWQGTPVDGANAEKDLRQQTERRPAPATNIDEDDDPPLAELNDAPAGRELPVLLFNAAVNGISLTDLEGRAPRQWPFTFSQHYSGSPANGIGYSATSNFMAGAPGKGLTLGAAMAVSGAAVSPTSGTSTHPLRAFLMGILNARLGMWIGNPSHPEAVMRASPRLGGFTVLREMLGLRARFGDWIHLSDGGHFENLGVYELVRRGCLRIVAIDASCDPDRHFEDFADAVRRARIDLGVQIHPRDHWCIKSPSDESSKDGRAWMWFEIDYGKNLPAGRLLYIKPSVYDHDKKLQAEVLNYWRQAKQFPHESTINQFFSERQMEAYRALGESCTVAALASAVSKDREGDPGFVSLLHRSTMRQPAD